MLLGFLYFYDFSAWWLILAGIISFLLSYLLYFTTNNLGNKKVNLILFFIRYTVIFIILLLIINPILKTKLESIEKPILILALDESKSIVNNTENKQKIIYTISEIDKLSKKLSLKFDVKKVKFGSIAKHNWSGNFNDTETNINNLFDFIGNQFIDKNIGGLVIASDGIVNRGSEYITQKKYPIYTIALGDTSFKKDIAINSINVNPAVTLNNTHEVKININSFGLKGKLALLNVFTNDGQQYQKTLNVNNNNFYASVALQIKTKRKGLQKIYASILKMDGEKIIQNNKKDAFINVIDKKYNVLLYAKNPHPDISAIKSSIESYKSYHLDLSDHINDVNLKKYDLVIFFHTPINNLIDDNLLKNLLSKPKIFFLGQKTSNQILNNHLRNVQINSINHSYQYPTVNNQFLDFTINKEMVKMVETFPSILQYHSLNYKSVLISSPLKNSPIISFNDYNNVRYALFNGEGFWKWRMKNYVLNNNHELFDEMINRTIQWLITTNQSETFIVKPSNFTFKTNEKITFEAYLNNQSKSSNNNIEINLILKNKNKSFNYTFSQTNSSGFDLEVGYLPIGNYSYLATTYLNGKKLTATGEINISENLSELDQIPSNISLLNKIAQNSAGGKLIFTDSLNNLYEDINSNEKIKPIINNKLKYDELINLKLMMILLLILLTIEWFLRKRNSLQ